MPTTLGRKYKTDWLGIPPHMLDTDVPVWHRYLEQWGSIFTEIYYDCLVGGPSYTPEELKDPMNRMWRANASKRIDAVGVTADQVWIIEVARSPGLRALGQLQVYRALWLEDPPIEKIEVPILVCEVVDQDLIYAASVFGVQTIVCPP